MTPEPAAPAGVGDLLRTALADRDAVLLYTGVGESRTRGELADLAEGFQALLEAEGAGPGDVVLLEFSRQSWPLYVAAYLGTHLAGCVPAVISGESGSDRREAVLDALAVRCAVASGSGERRSWDECDIAWFPVDDARRAAGLPNEALADYLVTSGTTGKPKLVPVPVGRRFPAFAAGHEPGVVIQSAPPGSNASQSVLAEALAGGGALACLDTWDPARFVALAQASGAGKALLAPALLQSLLAWRGLDPERLRGIGTLRLGMAPAGEHLLRAAAERMPWLSLTNIYTTTEAWPAGTTMRYAKDDAATVGRPLPGTSVRIVTETGEQAAPGESGRIQLSHDSDGVWIDTGDLGSLDADGQLVFAGRETDLVTRGGAVVSLLEVENAVLASGDVADAAAFIVEGAQDRHLAVAVVWAGAERPDDLRAGLAERLGASAVPSTVVAVPAIPRDSQGKLRRGELTLPQAEAPGGAGADSVAEVLKDIWREVLMCGEIGPDDDFVRLGGDSLAAVVANTLVEERLGVILPLSDHYEATRFADLLARVVGALGAAGS